MNDAPVITSIDDAVVSEEGLLVANGALADGNIDSNGNPSDSSDIVSFAGSYSVTNSDGGALTVTLAAPLTPISSGGIAVTWSGDGTNTLVGSASGQEIIRITATDPVAGTGSYTVTLSGPVDHALGDEENLLNLDVGLNISDGVLTTTDTFTVTIEDDSPIGTNVVQNLNASSDNVTTNLILVLDTSGSMAGTLDDAVQSLLNLIESADNGGNVNIRIVRFGSNAQASEWFVDDVQSAAALLESFTASGGTNYSAALETLIAAENTNPAPLADQTLLYFVSDGSPAGNAGVANGVYNGIPGVAGWEAYVAANIDVAYGIGIPGASLPPLQNVAFPNDNGEENAFLLNDVNDLSDTLLATFNQGSISGSLNGSGASNAVGFALGADGGYISAIVIDGISYSYNPATANPGDEVIVVATALGGELTFNFLDGNYQYSIEVSTDLLGEQEVFMVTATDADGDSVDINFVVDIDFSPAVDANVDSILTNVVDGSAIDIPEAALMWNDSQSNGAVTIVGNSLNGNASLSNGTISFTPLQVPPLSESDFETTAPALTISEAVGDSESTPLNNSMATAIDFTDRSLFSLNDDNININANLVDNYSIQFNGNIASDGNTANGKDEDWIKLNLVEGESVWFDIDPPSIGDIDIFIYDSNGNQIAQIAENGGGPNGAFDVPYSDNFYVVVQATGATSSGNYFLDISIDASSAQYTNTFESSFDYTLTANGMSDSTSVSIQGIANATIDGTDSDEILVGSDNADTLNASGGNDALVGHDGDDILDGGEGSDILFGGQGADSLTGGTGVDTFVWQAGDADGLTDTVTDFTAGPGGDVLDFSDLLQGEDSNNLGDYLTVTYDGVADTTITIDADGVGGDADVVVLLEGIDLTAGLVDQAAIMQQLLDNGNVQIG